MDNSKYKIICSTLYDKDYHYGVAALLNSLYKNSFNGLFCIGYRDKLPFWVNQLEPIENELYRINSNSNIEIQFIKITTDVHLANYKPTFLIKLFQDFKNCEKLYYFDSDITIKTKFSYFENWVNYGIALCQESSLHRSHPMRRFWKDYFKNKGFTFNNENIDYYINAGFIGIQRENIDFLRNWESIIFNMSDQCNLKILPQPGGRLHPFCYGDQDALNATLMLDIVNISLVGKDGMDIIPGYIMSHTMGTPKIWNKHLIIECLRGRRLKHAEQYFFQNIRYPIKLYNNFIYINKRFQFYIAKFFSLFLKRKII